MGSRFHIPFGFSDPQWLWLLLLIPLAWWLDRHSLVLLSTFRRRASLFIRTTVILFLVLALAGFRLELKSDDLTVIFAVDKSESVAEPEIARAINMINAASAHKRTRDKGAVIVFADDALVEASPSPALRVEKLESAPLRGYTDLSKAIRLAVGLFPEGTQRRLIVFSDGNENLGNALSDATVASANDVPIDVISLKTASKDEVLVESIQIPDKVDKKKPFDIRITVWSSYAGPATLRLYKDRNFAGQNEVNLNEGKNIFLFPQEIEDAGFHTYEAMVDTPRDTVRDNNQAGAYTLVFGESKVLLVGPDEDTRFLKEALAVENIPADVSPSPPLNAAEAESYDAIFLCNLSAEKITNPQMKLLQGYCGDLGGGIAMLGGEDSFGLGGYHNTPVEEAMPVSMEIKNKKNFPSLGLVVLVDKSGSMEGGLPGNNLTKLQLAAEAAVKASQQLTSRDYLGVVGFDSAAKWVQDFQPVVNLDEIAGNIRSIRSGGGTDAIPGFHEALRALAGVKIQLRHVIMISDGMVQPGDYDKVIRDLNGLKATLTTVGVGDDTDRTFMQKMANATGGRFYFTNDPNAIPKIFTKETVIAQRSYLIEEDFTPKTYQTNEITKGISGYPPLHGYVSTEEKDRAEVLLKSHKGDVVLAAWRYRGGKSLAWTSDARDRWARDWMTWSEGKKFWSQAARWVMRNRKEGVLQPRITINNGTARVSVEAVTEKGEFVNFLDLDAAVMTPALDTKHVKLRQTAAGRYEAEFEAKEVGTYLASVSGDKVDAATAGASVSYAPEYRSLRSNQLLLNQIASLTGGKVDPQPGEFFRHEGQNVQNVREIWYQLLWSALLLFLADIAMRRVFLDAEQRAQVAAFARRLSPLRLAPRTAEAAATTLGALRTRQSTLRKGQRTTAETVTIQPAETPKTPAPETKPQTTPTIAEAFEKVRAAETKSPETKPGTPGETTTTDQSQQPAEGEASYTSRLLEARRKARERNSKDEQ